jgi:hypothetical protein
MIKVMDSKTDIRGAQELFEKTIGSSASIIIPRPILNPSGQTQIEKLFWFENDRFWISFVTRNLPRYFMNAMGVENPNILNAPVTVIELNFPATGLNRHVQGCFGVKDSDDIVLLHRGRLGGRYAGANLIDYIHANNCVSVDDGGKPQKMVLVARLESSTLLKQLSTFVCQVNEIKRKYKSS